jgi:hypothetical protein
MNFATPLTRPFVQLTRAVAMYGCLFGSSFVRYTDHENVVGYPGPETVPW